MMAVVTTACLLCVFFGYLMGLSVSRPNPPKAKSDDVHHVIRPAAMVDAAAFETISADLMALPEVNHRTIQGTPLRMLKIKLLKLIKGEVSRAEASILEKGMMNVDEAVFSDCSGVSSGMEERFKVDLLPLLEFISEDGSSDPDLNCFFGLTKDGGKSISTLVVILSSDGLNVVRLVGQIDPAVMDILASCGSSSK